LSEQYHLGELKIAQDPNHPAHILPPSVPIGTQILDVGCGAGQTLIASYPNRITHGIDVDFRALLLGSSLTDRIQFVCGRAEALPYPSECFDLVTARVSLAYMNIRKSLREIRRVLKPGAMLWMTLHSFSVPWESAKKSNLRGKVYFGYIILNSSIFHVLQRNIPFFGTYESFQTENGMKRALERCGFDTITTLRGQHFVMTAKRI
jgi:ubiquinone/menaquinone biosynthesis C-methylase UbiE